MGRKIPGKKCKKIKDPEKQRAARLESLKGKINSPPAFPDVQETPHSLERLIRLKEKCKETKVFFKRQRKSKKFKIDTEKLMGKEVDLPGMTKPVRNVPNINQREGENEIQYVHRVERLCQNIIKESKFEKKFGVEVCRNPDSGAIEEVRKCLDEDPVKQKRSPKNSSRSEIKKLKRSKCKKALRKLSKLERNGNDFSHLQDNVKFGEVVDQPPALKVLPRKADVRDSESKPGKKDLLLKKLLAPKSTSTVTTGKIKWREMPVGEKMRIEQERENAIKAYKLLKAQKYKNSE
ncbi:hypothetical protein J437_LFUL001185 [Ladona fulva]|uniref:Coiled-coil domain-containing protein 137 n=1 Tax=Ladona fulva TaxID=123851 RepID=A0A8K0NVC8_LADFU|nr:hypothetical protein J437_LFUL001185 [Ladona fulva]